MAGSHVLARNAKGIRKLPVVCYTAVFIGVPQRATPLSVADDTKNGCVADYQGTGNICFVQFSFRSLYLTAFYLNFTVKLFHKDSIQRNLFAKIVAANQHFHFHFLTVQLWGSLTYVLSCCIFFSIAGVSNPSPGTGINSLFLSTLSSLIFMGFLLIEFSYLLA